MVPCIPAFNIGVYFILFTSQPLCVHQKIFCKNSEVKY